ncbi:MAG: hypothetical protein J0H18_00720 [Rhizobiales bacterium]|mgnify:CR=1 FL=1|nr:hypothetical protein [Hyphomicrobiales bacterium]OJY07421.1 MAG: hypothetical protein BGP07_05910 [Rhizobiales bacterium 63-22]
MRVIAGIGGLLAAALSLGLSIYETRTAAEVKEIAADATVNAGQWDVTVHSGRLAAETPDGRAVRAGDKALTVDLTLDNLTAESSNLYRETLKLENVSGAPAPQFYLLRDRDLLSDLQPMMPEKIAAVWVLPASQPLPEVLKVAIVGTTYKAQDNLYAASGWFNPQTVARVELPLASAAKGAAP